MSDREIVLIQLEGVGVGLDMAGYHTDAQCVRDALALLREQDPVKPIAEGKRPYRWFRCGNCEEPLYGPWNYCPKCGRAVKWGA